MMMNTFSNSRRQYSNAFANTPVILRHGFQDSQQYAIGQVSGIPTGAPRHLPTPQAQLVTDQDDMEVQTVTNLAGATDRLLLVHNTFMASASPHLYRFVEGLPLGNYWVDCGSISQAQTSTDQAIRTIVPICSQTHVSLVEHRIDAQITQGQAHGASFQRTPQGLQTSRDILPFSQRTISKSTKTSNLFQDGVHFSTWSHEDANTTPVATGAGASRVTSTESHDGFLFDIDQHQSFFDLNVNSTAMVFLLDGSSADGRNILSHFGRYEVQVTAQVTQTTGTGDCDIKIEYGSYYELNGTAARDVELLAEANHNGSFNSADKHPLTLSGESIYTRPLPPTSIKVTVTFDNAYDLDAMQVRVRLVTGSPSQRAYPVLNLLLIEDLRPDQTINLAHQAHYYGTMEESVAQWLPPGPLCLIMPDDMYMAAAICHACYALGLPNMLTPDERQKVQAAMASGELSAGSFMELVKKTGKFLNRVLKVAETIAPIAVALMAGTHQGDGTGYKLTASTVIHPGQIETEQRARRVGKLPHLPDRERQPLGGRTSATRTKLLTQMPSLAPEPETALPPVAPTPPRRGSDVTTESHPEASDVSTTTQGVSQNDLTEQDSEELGIAQEEPTHIATQSPQPPPDLMEWLRGECPATTEASWREGDMGALLPQITQLLQRILLMYGLPGDTFLRGSEVADPVQSIFFLLTRNPNNYDGLEDVSARALHLNPCLWVATIARHIMGVGPVPTSVDQSSFSCPVQLPALASEVDPSPPPMPTCPQLVCGSDPCPPPELICPVPETEVNSLVITTGVSAPQSPLPEEARPPPLAEVSDSPALPVEAGSVLSTCTFDPQQYEFVNMTMSTLEIHAALTTQIRQVQEQQRNQRPPSPESPSSSLAQPSQLSAASVGEEEVTKARRVAAPNSGVKANPLSEYIVQHSQPDIRKPNFTTYRNFAGAIQDNNTLSGVRCRVVMTTTDLPSGILPDYHETVRVSEGSLEATVHTNVQPTNIMSSSGTAWFEEYGAYAVTQNPQNKVLRIYLLVEPRPGEWRFANELKGASCTWAIAAALTGVHNPNDPDCFFIGISSPLGGWNTPTGVSLAAHELTAKLDYLRGLDTFTYSLLIFQEPSIHGYSLSESSNLTDHERHRYFDSNTLMVSKSVFSAITESPLELVSGPDAPQGSASSADIEEYRTRLEQAKNDISDLRAVNEVLQSKLADCERDLRHAESQARSRPGAVQSGPMGLREPSKFYGSALRNLTRIIKASQQPTPFETPSHVKIPFKPDDLGITPAVNLFGQFTAKHRGFPYVRDLQGLFHKFGKQLQAALDLVEDMPHNPSLAIGEKYVEQHKRWFQMGQEMEADIRLGHDYVLAFFDYMISATGKHLTKTQISLADIYHRLFTEIRYDPKTPKVNRENVDKFLRYIGQEESDTPALCYASVRFASAVYETQMDNLLSSFDRIRQGKLQVDEGITFNWPQMMLLIMNKFQVTMDYAHLTFYRPTEKQMASMSYVKTLHETFIRKMRAGSAALDEDLTKFLVTQIKALYTIGLRYDGRVGFAQLELFARGADLVKYLERDMSMEAPMRANTGRDRSSTTLRMQGLRSGLGTQGTRETQENQPAGRRKRIITDVEEESKGGPQKTRHKSNPLEVTFSAGPAPAKTGAFKPSATLQEPSIRHNRFSDTNEDFYLEEGESDVELDGAAGDAQEDLI